MPRLEKRNTWGGTLTLDGEKLTFTPRNHSDSKVEIGTVDGEADRARFYLCVYYGAPEPSARW